jgi:hypothetical protein
MEVRQEFANLVGQKKPENDQEAIQNNIKNAMNAAIKKKMRVGQNKDIDAGKKVFVSRGKIRFIHRVASVCRPESFKHLNIYLERYRDVKDQLGGNTQKIKTDYDFCVKMDLYEYILALEKFLNLSGNKKFSLKKLLVIIEALLIKEKVGDIACAEYKKELVESEEDFGSGSVMISNDDDLEEATLEEKEILVDTLVSQVQVKVSEEDMKIDERIIRFFVKYRYYRRELLEFLFTMHHIKQKYARRFILMMIEDLLRFIKNEPLIFDENIEHFKDVSNEFIYLRFIQNNKDEEHLGPKKSIDVSALIKSASAKDQSVLDDELSVDEKAYNKIESMKNKDLFETKSEPNKMNHEDDENMGLGSKGNLHKSLDLGKKTNDYSDLFKRKQSIEESVESDQKSHKTEDNLKSEISQEKVSSNRTHESLNESMKSYKDDTKLTSQVSKSNLTNDHEIQSPENKSVLVDNDVKSMKQDVEVLSNHSNETKTSKIEYKDDQVLSQKSSELNHSQTNISDDFLDSALKSQVNDSQLMKESHKSKSEISQVIPSQKNSSHKSDKIEINQSPVKKNNISMNSEDEIQQLKMENKTRKAKSLVSKTLSKRDQFKKTLKGASKSYEELDKKPGKNIESKSESNMRAVKAALLSKVKMNLSENNMHDQEPVQNRKEMMEKFKQEFENKIKKDKINIDSAPHQKVKDIDEDSPVAKTINKDDKSHTSSLNDHEEISSKTHDKSVENRSQKSHHSLENVSMKSQSKSPNKSQVSNHSTKLDKEVEKSHKSKVSEASNVNKTQQPVEPMPKEDASNKTIDLPETTLDKRKKRAKKITYIKKKKRNHVVYKKIITNFNMKEPRDEENFEYITETTNEYDQDEGKVIEIERITAIPRTLE